MAKRGSDLGPGTVRSGALQGHSLRRVAEAVERLVTVDVSCRGIVGPLHAAARASVGDEPTVLAAARGLYERSRPRQHVIIATGLPIRGWFDPAISENDGPAGAATLGRALLKSLQVVPVLICEEPQVPVLTACTRAAGLIPTSFEAIAAADRSTYKVEGRTVPAAVVEGFPSEDASAVRKAEELLSHDPAAVISIERQGADAAGGYHYGRGELNKRECMAKVDILFERANKKGVMTVGVGDGGNELGMGRIKDTIREHVPFGDLLAPEVPAEILVVATVSNWGAWGIEACLAAMAGDLDVLHSPEIERAVISACTAAGAVDGATGFVEPVVDAVPMETAIGLLQLMHLIVGKGLDPPEIYR